MISLYDLIQAANGQLFGEPAAQIFADFTLDPDQVSSTHLYVSLPIEHGDTEATICRAIANGVGGVVCIDPPTCDTTGVSVIMVADPVTALLDWAQFIIERMHVKVIAVAGSDGQSTTLQAVHAVLSTQYKVHIGTIETRGRLSLPLSLASLESEHDVAVIEFAAENPGDMEAFLEHVQPDVGIILSLDCHHIDRYQSCDQYLAEQQLLFTSLPEDGMAVANFDDDSVMQLANQLPSATVTIGVDRFGADLIGFNVVVGSRRTGFDLRIGSERFVARWTPLLGKYHLYSALASLAVGQQFGISLEDGLRALTVLSPLPGHLNPLVGLNDSLLIDDTYRATVTSSLAALDLLDTLRTSYKRRFFVLGDMDDVHQQSVRAHRIVGQRAAGVVDVFITQGMEASAAARAALDAGMSPTRLHTTYSTQDTLSTLLQYDLTADDIILIKGGIETQMSQTVVALMQNPEDVSRVAHQKQGAKSIRAFTRPLRPTWIEIYPDILAKNTRYLRDMLADDVTLMAVVKANAYGHGAVITARVALQNGASYLAVANIAEALELRDAGIEAPILVFSYLPVESVRQAIQQDITATVFDLEIARQYNRIAQDIDGQLRCHVKVDTGMGRLGFMPSDVMYTFRHLVALKQLAIEGIYTHFSMADEDSDYTRQQVETFRGLIRPLTASGIKLRYTHAANSPATLYRDGTHFNLVRPGLALYGMNNSSDGIFPQGLQPFLSWKTTVLQVKDLPAGYPVGYGNTYRTRTDERIAILPVGYADGFRRAPRTWRHVLINGQKAPVVGRISMEKTAVDVSRIADVYAGDEVVLIGEQGNERITVDDVANWLGTINYEVVTTLNGNIPRIIISQ